MRKLILTAILPFACLFVNNCYANSFTLTDSVKITHVLDGNISEWGTGKFETDKETNVQYAVDHDATNLYLAAKIVGMPLQMKMLSMGMDVYLDKKGKKREGTGIHFPMRKEGGFGGGGGRPGGGQPGGGQPGEVTKPDMTEMRDRMAAGMLFLKTFGFENQDEEKTQMIVEEGGINISFDWDTEGNLVIEYLFPLQLLGPTAALNGKPLGIGWKINGMESSVSGALPTGPAVGARGGRGGGGGGGRGGGGGGAQLPSSDSRFREQSIWTKYVLTF